MKKKVDLVSGNILKTLVTLSLPILGTAFIQMAYSLVDMIWIGRAGSAAVAAVGTAGFFSWFGNSLVTISKTGAEVGVSQAIGKNNSKERNEYVYSSLFLCITMAIIYGILLIVFRDGLIGFFNLGDETIIRMSKEYLIVIALGMICAFINPQLTGIFTASGNSKTPFIVNTIGLVMNIVLDPILIFGMFNIKPLGVVGAALATVFSQLIVSLIFIYTFIKHGYNISFNNRKYINRKIIKRVCKYGGPTAIQNCLFTFFSMLIGRVVAMAGPVSIAVQKVGSQIESISWNSCDGFASALSSFVGQNYGAKKIDRINKSTKYALIGVSIWGVITTAILVFLGEPIFRTFINEPDAIIKGTDYLKILGYSQLFMCFEITVSGIFKGLGRTYIPSIIIAVLTGMRIPMAILLCRLDVLGLNGIWWSITISSIVKGILLLSILVVLRKTHKLYKVENL